MNAIAHKPVPSDLASRLRDADRPLLEQGKFSDVRSLLREAADVIASYSQTTQPADEAFVLPVPNGAKVMLVFNGGKLIKSEVM